MNISHDVDFNIRLIEVCKTVSHIPEVLYRWRLHSASLGHQETDRCRAMTRAALERHFVRSGQSVEFDDESYFNFRNFRFRHESPARVAIIVSATDDSDRLRDCIRGLETTVSPSLRRSSSWIVDRITPRPLTN